MFSKFLPLAVAASVLSCSATFAAETKPAGTEEKKAEAPKKRAGTKWDAMDHGPFLSSHLDTQPRINKALSIDLGNGAAVAFDTEMCRLAFGWTGGFVRLPTGRDGLEGMPKPEGTNFVFTTPAGPGWADANGEFTDGRPEYKGRKYGPLPKEHAKWKGVYVDGNTAVLSYTVGKASVLETHSFIQKLTPSSGVFRRRIEVTPANSPLATIVCRANEQTKIEGKLVTIPDGDQVTIVALRGEGEWALAPEALVLRLPGAQPSLSYIYVWRGPSTEAAMTKNLAGELRAGPGEIADLISMVSKYRPRWGAPLPVPGKLSTDTNSAYVVDTIPVPENNPFNSWIRCSGIDFFKGGTRAAVCSVSGDVWLVDNIDEKLDRVTWQRFATGLFQPLGLRIVDDKVYVLGRDQITRLHDYNNDGEADFYENFNNDVAAFLDYHEFALDLQIDSEGNFYFAKGGNLGEAKHPHNGCVIKVSKDGSKLETVANGLRAPNGMGMGPNNEISVSDNDGNWVPASRFSIIKPGGFYGHVQNAFKTPKPTTYDNPVCWLPKNIDNSSGGQVWVTSDKWGPFGGDMLHMSYGHCSLFKVLLDRVDGEYQGGVVKFPLKFDTGIMRGQFNERDGQLYVTGLVVWQSDGAKKGQVHRVRYTGQPVHMPTKLRATTKGVALTFTSPLDEASATDVANWNVEQWNYKWTGGYGSPEFSVADPEKKGHDKVEVKSAKLSADKKTVFLEVPTIQPVMQQKIAFNLKAADGATVKHDVYHSIYKLAP